MFSKLAYFKQCATRSCLLLTQILASVRIIFSAVLPAPILTILDIDNPDALQKYHGLLLSVIRVIVSVVFVRGLHNEQILEQTRAFLAENRSCMVGVFKRIAKIGAGGATPEVNETLNDLAKSYMALVAATGFLEVCLLVENPVCC